MNVSRWENEMFIQTSWQALDLKGAMNHNFISTLNTARESSPLGQNLNRTYWSLALRNLFWAFWRYLSRTVSRNYSNPPGINAVAGRKLDRDMNFCALFKYHRLVLRTSVL
jgi:hypothetical protein